MHILITNNDIEISAFRRQLGAAAEELQVVENNLSALSLLGSNPGMAHTLTVSEYQDEGVNVDTRTFVRNLAARSLDSLEIIIVGQLYSDLNNQHIRVVPTIDDAAQIVGALVELQPVAVVAEPLAEPMHTSNGHGHYAPEDVQVTTPQGEHWDHAATTPAPPKPRAATVKLSEAFGSFQRQFQPQQVEAQPVVAPATPAPRPPIEYPPVEDMPATTRSLADDIRDWNDRADQTRGTQRSTELPRKGFMDWLTDQMPAARRAREEEARLDLQIRSPRLTRCNSIAVISPKGGVGKSFLTYVVGNFLAEVRGDKVVAIDTNPDFGTLADQVRGREPQTVSTLLEHLETIKHYSDLRRFTSKVESRLEVLAAPADPDVMATISANDYHRVYEQLHHYYDTILFDCGTGFRDDITRFALQQCDQIVLVSAPLFITTGIVIRALGYLAQIGCDLSRVTLAINQVRREKPLDLDYMRSRFGDRLNGIVEVPFDMQLYREMDTGEFAVDRVQSSTRISIKNLCVDLVKNFE